MPPPENSTFLTTGSSDRRARGRAAISGSSLTASDFSFLFRPFLAIVEYEKQKDSTRNRSSEFTLPSQESQKHVQSVAFEHGLWEIFDNQNNGDNAPPPPESGEYQRDVDERSSLYMYSKHDVGKCRFFKIDLLKFQCIKSVNFCLRSFMKSYGILNFVRTIKFRMVLCTECYQYKVFYVISEFHFV